MEMLFGLKHGTRKRVEQTVSTAAQQGLKLSYRLGKQPERDWLL